MGNALRLEDDRATTRAPGDFPQAGRLAVRALDRIRAWASGLKRETVVLWFAVRDPQTPFAAKVMAWAILAYALSPIDLIPDFIPILGYVDELLLLPLAIWGVIRLVPAEIMARSRARAEQWLAAGQSAPTSRLGAVLVVAVWVVIVWWLIALLAPSLGHTGSAGYVQVSPGTVPCRGA
jgi:uncharacterized membrane protein YkvA (DUF1232 family)